MCDPPCQNGGECVDSNECVCATGWKGERCEQGIAWNDVCCGCVHVASSPGPTTKDFTSC